jgi:CO/xanthine dehydrogenase Mo-binding subunit
MTGTKVIGAALLRKEDYRFVTGQGRYLDDIVFPGCLRILSARRMPMPGSPRSIALRR